LSADFDIHFGNGCQDIFYEDNSVLTLSIHRQDFVVQQKAVEEDGKESIVHEMCEFEEKVNKISNEFFLKLSDRCTIFTGVEITTTFNFLNV
jgi:acetoin utilization deacetylase AcuC-like enzyme